MDIDFPAYAVVLQKLEDGSFVNCGLLLSSNDKRALPRLQHTDTCGWGAFGSTQGKPVIRGRKARCMKW